MQVNTSGITETNATINCKIETVEKLTVTPIVYWSTTHRSDITETNITSLSNTITRGNITYSTLSIHNLQTSDAGIYFCETKISIDVLSKNIVQKGNVTLFIERKLCVLDLMT